MLPFPFVPETCINFVCFSGLLNFSIIYFIASKFGSFVTLSNPLKYSSIVIFSSLYKYFFTNGLRYFSSKNIVITCIGSIILWVTSLDAITAKYAFPYSTFKNADSSRILIPPRTITLLIINWKINFKSFLFSSGFLYKNIPYTNPINADDIVKPGKYAPNGNKIAPIKSPSPAIIAEFLGPQINCS